MLKNSHMVCCCFRANTLSENNSMKKSGFIHGEQELVEPRLRVFEVHARPDQKPLDLRGILIGIIPLTNRLSMGFAPPTSLLPLLPLLSSITPFLVVRNISAPNCLSWLNFGNLRNI